MAGELHLRDDVNDKFFVYVLCLSDYRDFFARKANTERECMLPIGR